MAAPSGVLQDVDQLSLENVRRLAHELAASKTELETRNEELGRSEAFLQAVIDAIPEITVVIDQDYRVLFANRAARQMAGDKDPVSSCLKCHQFSHHSELPCEGSHEPCPLKEVIESGRPMTVEHIHYDAAGDKVYVEVTASPVFDEKGKVVQIVEICRDIGERKQAEESLKKESDASEAVLDSLPGVFYMFDEQGRFRRWNKSFEEVSGYSAEEISQLSPLDFIAEQDRPLVAQGIQEVFTAGFADVEAGFRAKNGREIPFFFNGVRREIGGKPYLLGMGLDITERKRAEAALRVSERGYREIFDASNDGIAIVDPESGTVLDANQSWCEMTGYSREEARRLNLQDFSLEEPPYTKEDALRYHKKTATEGPQLFTWLHKKKNGELFWGEVNLRLANIGGAERVLAVVRDITDRTLAEENLRLTQFSMDNAAESIFWITPDAKFAYVNDTACRKLGYSRRELLAMTVHDIAPEYPKEAWPEHWRELRRRGSFVLESIHRTKSGTSIPVEVTVNYLEFAGKVYNCAFARDISDRKRAERERSRLIGVLESTSDMVVSATLDGRLTYMNRAGRQMLGWGVGEDIATKAISDVHPGWASDIVFGQGIPTAIRDGIWAGETAMLGCDGKEIPVSQVIMSHKSANGEVEYLSTIARDITDRKQVEREHKELIASLESKNAELERFAYTVSHDLKSPLITIQGFAGLLRQDLAANDAQQVNDDLSHICGAADKMYELLQEVLELSRIGRRVNPPEDVSLRDLAAEAAKLVGGSISDKDVRVNIGPDLPVLYGDRTRLREVLQNLIENAVKYLGDQPHPCIEIGSRQDGGEVVCYVRDNGIGIDPAYHKKVFGLFEQLDPKVDGTGIGLALVKRIVEIHGGRIWVESEGEGHGSTFCFTIAPKPSPSPIG